MYITVTIVVLEKGIFKTFPGRKTGTPLLDICVSRSTQWVCMKPSFGLNRNWNFSNHHSLFRARHVAVLLGAGTLLSTTALGPPSDPSPPRAHGPQIYSARYNAKSRLRAISQTNPPIDVTPPLVTRARNQVLDPQTPRPPFFLSASPEPINRSVSAKSGKSRSPKK